MNRLRVGVLVLAVLVAAVGLAAAEKMDGTTAEDLAAAKLPSPSAVKVAVLPFYDLKAMEGHTRVVTSEVALLMTRCGFPLVPTPKTQNMADLAQTLAAAQKAVADDAEVAVGEPLRLGDAVRIGKTLGADWVVYGQVLDLHTYSKTSFMSTRKKGAANIKLNVADVATGRLILSRRLEDVGTGGGVIRRKASWLERTISLRCVNGMYRDLCAALPKHQHTPEEEVNEDNVMELEDLWGKLVAPGQSSE